ncbi:MAG: DUF4124 domain-containing protein [Burkholderiales bacterium]|nr:DUF4124 domain-containing protein [Burkholderiales bacterium]
MQKTALSLAACVLALAAAGAHAQALWKWRDASGQLHISDKAPPPGTPAKDILAAPPGGVLPPPAALIPKPASAAEAPAAGGSAAESALDRRKKAVDQEKADREKAERARLEASNAAIRKDNCARAQGALHTLQAGGRMARMNDKGEREFLDDAARADETKRAQDAIAANCGAAPAGQ